LFSVDPCLLLSNRSGPWCPPADFPNRQFFHNTVVAVPDIVIAETMHESAVLDLGRSFDVRYDHRLAASPLSLSGAIADARALIIGDGVVIDADLLAAAPRLQVIGSLVSLSGRVDEEACRARGIELHAPLAGEVGIADQVVAAAIRLLDQTGATERRLGLIGFGPVARAVAERARGLGLPVAAYDPMVAEDDPVWSDMAVEPLPLHHLLAESDAISLHIPLTEETRDLIDWETILEMRRGAVLINASRAGVVDRGAVAAAVRRGLLGGVLLALDDADAETPPDGAGIRIAGKVRAALEARTSG
jgi:(S)-sulfolactate dehydrogenase